MEEIPKHYWLYVLLLKEGKYYVGITAQKDPHVRIMQHVNGTFMASGWVRKYPYKKTLELVDLGTMTKAEAELIENEYTRRYIQGFGHNKVRGGTLSHPYNYIKIGNRLYHWKKDDLVSLASIVFLLFVIAFLAYQLYASH